MTIQDKKQQIIEEYYCNDIHCESYDLYCGNCKDLIKKDIDELEKFIRADAIDEFGKALERASGETDWEDLDKHWILPVAEQLKEQ